MTSSLFALLSQTYRSVITRWRVVGAAVCVITAVLMLSQGIYAWRVETYRASLFDQSSVERDATELDGLLDRQRAGDSSVDAQVLSARRRLSERLQTLAGRQTIVGFWINLGPALLLSWFLAALALIGGLLHGIREAASADRSVKDVIIESARAIGPLSLLLLLLFCVTLLWIPAGAIMWTHLWPQTLTDTGSTIQTALVFFGYFVAILLLPRLLLAPLFVTCHGMTPWSAMRESFVASRGYWGKMLGNVIAAGLLLFFVNLTVILLLGPSLNAVPFLPLILQEFLTAASMVIFGVLLGHLSQTVAEHPLFFAEETAPEPVPAMTSVEVPSSVTTQPTLA